MPDTEGNLTDQDIAQTLGWPRNWADSQPGTTAGAAESEPSPTPTPVVQPVVGGTPAPVVTPPGVGGAPVVTPPAKAPITPQPDLRTAEATFRSQQAQFQIQQAQAQYQQRLISQQGLDPTVAATTAQFWANQQWSDFVVAETRREANESKKQDMIAALARQHDIDPQLLQAYNDPTSMTAAAIQAGELKRLQSQVNKATEPAKTPVQQFAGGTATPLASNARKQLDYVSGLGPSLTAEQFMERFGFAPDS